MRATFALALFATWLAWVAIASAEPRAPGQLALEQRFVAPCCWVQTLDVHDSPLARELREEIRVRLGRGDSAANIEADFVNRFGPKVVAMSSDNPLAKVAIAVGVLVLLAALLIARTVYRWSRAPRTELMTASAAAPTVRDEWDNRLDEELRDAP